MFVASAYEVIGLKPSAFSLQPIFPFGERDRVRDKTFL
ncbi:hypothetical protein A45J_1797 [hot springs metagenome]|uniref:Uncharacterized protein n=1 Tax=hot springs metagenome TaxID=433727 RepID=A0A5J4L7B9_9ZZZZ